METLQYLLVHLYICIWKHYLHLFTMYLQDSQINLKKKTTVHTMYSNIILKKHYLYAC